MPTRYDELALHAANAITERDAEHERVIALATSLLDGFDAYLGAPVGRCFVVPYEGSKQFDADGWLQGGVVRVYLETTDGDHWPLCVDLWVSLHLFVEPWRVRAQALPRETARTAVAQLVRLVDEIRTKVAAESAREDVKPETVHNADELYRYLSRRITEESEATLTRYRAQPKPDNDVPGKPPVQLTPASTSPVGFLHARERSEP